MDKFTRLLGYGRDVAQGASNAIASNVSAPVDGLSWLLRKAGVPVPATPMGGSDWMAQQGLTRDPENRMAGLVGEFAGMAGPMVAAAKAPQIAAGVNRMAENAMAPSTLNKQAGAIVWHGSPHKFPPTAKNQLGEFDFSKIGTGEGAQSYGHGGYLADLREVGKGYKDTLSQNDLINNGRRVEFKDMDSLMAGVTNDIASKKGDVKSVRAMYEQMAGQKFGGDVAKQRISVLDSLGPNVGAEKGGYLYKVDLPDEHIAKMLDWDSPLSKQSPGVQAALQPLNIPDKEWMTGAKIYERFGGKGKFASSAERQSFQSDELRNMGIPGIRYLDGGSRNLQTNWIAKHPQGGENVFSSEAAVDAFIKRNPELQKIAPKLSSNYVVFPGNENMLNILQRNGQAAK